MKIFVSMIFLVLGGPLLAANTKVASKSNPEDLYSEFGPDFLMLTVDKKFLRAELRTVPAEGADGKLLQAFTVAIGKELGDKQIQGDNKTPEGIYFTLSVLDGATLPAKYGPFAIPLDYPNPIDRMLGKTGYGIWLHGVIKDERVEEANVTEGCVAFYNADIVKLTRWLMPNQGVVVIAEDTGQVNRPLDTQEVLKATTDWADAWGQRDIERYSSHYSSDFRSAGYDKDGYRAYKERVFNSYKVMKVTTSNLRVISHPKYAVAIMDQDFFGDDRFSSVGRKILYWQKSGDGNWRIMREIYENRRVEFVKFSSQDDKSGKQAAVTDAEQGDVQSKL